MSDIEPMLSAKRAGTRAKRVEPAAEPGPRDGEGPALRRTRGRTSGKRVTMTDVARGAGCSQSTVSVVLNNTPGIRISRDTRDRVLKTATQLGYEIVPGHAALVGRPHQIAIVFDRIATSPEAVVSIDGACETAWTSGHVVTIAQTLNDPEMEPLTIEAMLRNGVDAVVYGTIMTRKVEVPRQLYTARMPVVLLNCYSDDRVFPTVLPGEVAGGHRATDALLAAGHRRIAIITGEMWMDAARDRLRGYRQALATADIPYDPALVREGNWQTSAGYEHTHKLMEMRDPPTAIFCSNDRMAVGCYEALKERGLLIPGDVSVIGYDDEEVARHLSPQLTTLVLPHREMGRWAIEKALSLAENPTTKHTITKLECPLIERDSIRKIA
jgi:LacI family transcriptional regulator